MSDSADSNGIRDRLQRGGEEAVGRVVQDLIENPVLTGALSRAFEARERATQAQETAMGVLNLPSASDLARLTRRVRSVGQRLEGVEDLLDRLESKLGSAGDSSDIEERLAAIEAALTRLEQQASKPAVKAAPRATARKAPAAKRAPARKKPSASA
jgi:hypothetical protein